MKRIGDYEGSDKGYSVWENTDKDLVKKIKSFELVEDDNVVHDMFQGECEVIERISEGEILAKNKNGKHVVINPKPYRERLLQAINDEFKVSDHFTNNFGVVASHDGHIVLGLTDAISNPHRKESYDEVSVAGLNSFTIETSFYEGFEFEAMDCRNSVSCFFDENGNYVNRDLNLNLAKYEPVEPEEYKKTKVDEFMKDVSDRVSDKLFHIEGTDTWFSDNYAYVLNTYLEEYDIYRSFKIFVDAKPKQGSGNAYYHSGYSSNSSKLTKKCQKEVVTKESFLKIIRDEIENGLGLK